MSFTIPRAVRDRQVKELTKIWGNFFAIDVPSDTTFRGWLGANSFLTVTYGLREAWKKFCRVGGCMSQTELIKYSSRVMLSRTAVLKNLKQKENKQLCLTN